MTECPCSTTVSGYDSACTVHPAPRWYLDVKRKDRSIQQLAFEAWDELRVTAQPPGGFPPYDVTVRSDVDDTNGDPRWSQLLTVARRAYGFVDGETWDGVQVMRRHVEVRRSPWDPVPADELNGNSNPEETT